MNRFTFKMFGRTLAVAAAVGAVFSSAVAQDSSYIPIKANVNATVKAVPKTNENGAETVTLALTANAVDTLRLPYVTMTGVIYFAGQRRANAPIIAANRGGNITVNLPPQSYKSAEVALYTVNGKMVMSGKVSSLNAVNNISRRNVATGVYLLSVRGANSEAVTARFAHSGGGLSINTAFAGGSGSVADARKLAKESADAAMQWTVTVFADSYKDSVFTVQPVAGNNPLLNITLREGSSGGNGSYDFVEIDGLKWMNKNLNIQTEGSRCYGEGGQVRTDERDENDERIYVTLSPAEIQANCNRYGRLYTWEAAKTACQSIGWKLPDTADWNRLVNAAGGAETAGKKLKSKSGWDDDCRDGDEDHHCTWVSGNGNDNFGFSALPGGGGDYRNATFEDIGGYGSWWTATDNGSDGAIKREMRSSDYVKVSTFKNKNYLFSVRCVK